MEGIGWELIVIMYQTKSGYCKGVQLGSKREVLEAKVELGRSYEINLGQRKRIWMEQVWN